MEKGEDKKIYFPRGGVLHHQNFPKHPFYARFEIRSEKSKKLRVLRTIF